MTNYYDVSKPYSIKNWNDLIEDVNEILENPPYEATDCPPVEPIEKVEDPHIWKVKDVEEMRDKLKETCPDISFDEELEIWKKGIIDEIVEEMEKAWCDCEGEPEDDDQTLCTYTRQDLEAGPAPSQCCGVHNLSALTICGLSHEVSWTGVTAPVPQLDGEAMQAAYTEAYSATFEFIGTINGLYEISQDIDAKQDEIDSYVSTMRSYIAKFDAECKDITDSVLRPAHCPVTRQKICEFNSKALVAQGELEDLIADYAEQRADAMTLMETANSAAVTNSSNMLGWEGRFPPDHNVMADCISAHIPKWSWWDWWDPRHMPQIGLPYEYGKNRPSTPGTGILASVSSYRISSVWGPDRPQSNAYLRLSPNGSWYMSGGLLQNYVRNYTAPYQEKCDRFKCFAIFEVQCPYGICEWEPWTCQTWIWDQGWGLGFGQWVWQPLPPRDGNDYFTDEWHLRKRRLAGMKDNSEERDKWLDLYSKTEEWCKENEKYTGEEAEWYC